MTVFLKQSRIAFLETVKNAYDPYGPVAGDGGAVRCGAVRCGMITR